MSVALPRAYAARLSAGFVVVALGCGGGDAMDRGAEDAARAVAEAATDPAQSMSNAAQSMTAAVAQMQAAATAMAQQVGGDIPLVPAATLQERLPDAVDGLPRTNSEREQSGALGLSISTANATYNDETRRVEITLTDAGGTGIMAVAGAAWATVTVDKANADGYERTVMIDGNKGFEKESNANGEQRAELAVIAGGRLLISLEGTNVSMEVLRNALRTLRVNDLPVAP